MLVKQNSEDVVESLQSPENLSLRKLSFDERKKLLKRSKAMTSLQFRIASFSNFTWAVPFGYCDEVLNQLLFLSSL